MTILDVEFDPGEWSVGMQSAMYWTMFKPSSFVDNVDELLRAGKVEKHWFCLLLMALQVVQERYPNHPVGRRDQVANPTHRRLLAMLTQCSPELDLRSKHRRVMIKNNRTGTSLIWRVPENWWEGA